jgi:ABC-type maltose transport system permease subunit
MVQFIRGIPIELDEGTEIDGCSKVGIFFRIILPLIKGGVIRLCHGHSCLYETTILASPDGEKATSTQTKP